METMVNNKYNANFSTALANNSMYTDRNKTKNPSRLKDNKDTNNGRSTVPE